MSVLPATGSSASANNPTVTVPHSVDAPNSIFNDVHNHGYQANYEVHGPQTINQYYQHSTQERQELADWLSPLNFFQTQKDVHGSRRAGTGEWIFDDEKFKEWQRGDTKTLWCPGIRLIAGAGKTVLASCIIDHLEKNKNNDVAVIYIYCTYKDNARQTLHHLVSSLLKQLVQNFPSTFNNVKSEFKNHRERRCDTTLEEIQNTLIAETLKFSRVFTIVDALDEIPEDGDARFELLNILQSLGTDLLVTSRDITSIGIALHDAPRLDIRARDSDMRKYLEGRLRVETRLGRLLAKNLALREEVIEHIIKSAQGMFLLCCLHINSLACKTTHKDIRVALKTLPKELDSAYDETMKRIEGQNDHHRSLAIRAIMWIVKALRLLTVEELLEALAFSLNVHKINDEDLVDEILITDLCAGLVVVDVAYIADVSLTGGEYSVFRLVHHTTQEYFDKYTKWPFPYPHAEITRVCLEALSQPPNQSIRGWPFDGALSNYAAKNWGHHARGFVEEISNAMIQDFLHCERRVRLAIRCVSQEVSYFTLGDSALHLCAFFGLVQTTNFLLNKGATVDQRDKNVVTPLHNAVCNGHMTLATLLLRRGADVNASDMFGQTPFLFAAKLGRIDVLEMLLRGYGVDADSRTTDGRSPLSFAAELGWAQWFKYF